ncbi:hypothetical protein GB928_018495 [Shinella curvata]|uniref:Uncharacterized protein n=1 Tax=Shinella curvata TaxID=1817964 RepID=A0ABT8XHL7_9HYPH|nr:hypothetical protein [Shinella curvata]MCJ8053849.1 hypothetical protein [Shinella curvata]MDO6123181.1 hypothetical protein [Shinella curvata]
MTLSEFKAWFEGFTEGMAGTPDADQWKRIQARVTEIDGVAVTRTVFVDRYLPAYRPYWASRFDVSGISHGTMLLSAGEPSGFESHNAMLDLGKAEFSSALSARSIC